MPPTLPKDRLIVALDYPTAKEALHLVDSLEQTCQWFKVGMELYFAAGNQIVEQLRNRGFSVFLDLKLHDIPNTVASAIHSVTQGGAAMMTAAAEAAKSPNAPRLLAVTVLTSMDTEQLNGIGITASPADQVLRLAHLAEASGITGLVCSAEETALLRKHLSADTLLVVPGIRPVGSSAADQKRIATPSQAIASGASLLVVGRPITRAANPATAAHAILNEIEQEIASTSSI